MVLRSFKSQNKVRNNSAQGTLCWCCAEKSADCLFVGWTEHKQWQIIQCLSSAPECSSHQAPVQQLLQYKCVLATLHYTKIQRGKVHGLDRLREKKINREIYSSEEDDLPHRPSCALPLLLHLVKKTWQSQTLLTCPSLDGIQPSLPCKFKNHSDYDSWSTQTKH